MKKKILYSLLLGITAALVFTGTANAAPGVCYPDQTPVASLALCNAVGECVSPNTCIIDPNNANSYCCNAPGTTPVSTAINIAAPQGAIKNFGSLVSGTVLIIFSAAGIIAFVYLLLGGIKWITSGGDAGKVEEARSQIIQALIGVIVVLAAWALVVLIQNATGACFGLGCTIQMPTFV